MAGRRSSPLEQSADGRCGRVSPSIHGFFNHADDKLVGPIWHAHGELSQPTWACAQRTIAADLGMDTANHRSRPGHGHSESSATEYRLIGKWSIGTDRCVDAINERSAPHYLGAANGCCPAK